MSEATAAESLLSVVNKDGVTQHEITKATRDYMRGCSNSMPLEGS